MGLLFEKAPIEDEDSKKKRRSKRKTEPEFSPGTHKADYSPPRPYIASLDFACDRCGTPIIDLAEVLRNEWSVVCGWGCGRQWRIDPIPGVLDKQPANDDFVLRDRRFKGQTFNDVWSSGNEWYVLELAKLGNKTLSSRAAVQWLARKTD